MTIGRERRDTDRIERERRVDSPLVNIPQIPHNRIRDWLSGAGDRATYQRPGTVAAMHQNRMDDEALCLEKLASPDSMFASSEERRLRFPEAQLPPLIPPESFLHRMRWHQREAIKAAIKHVRSQVASGTPHASAIATTLREILEPGKRVKQSQQLPCGSGKTATAILLSLLTSPNLLFLTNNKTNANQFVNAVRTLTNVTAYFPLELIRSNGEGETGLIPTQVEQSRGVATFVTTSLERSDSTHILPNGGIFGIAVIDVNTFMELTVATEDRTDLRCAIFKSFWSTIVVDEVDSLCSEKPIEAFKHGARGDAPFEERFKHDEMIQFPLRFDHMFAMSGTFCRGKQQTFLNEQFGPRTFSVTSRTLEEHNCLANMTTVLIRCTPEEPSDSKNLSCDKLEVCERIVRLHTAHGQKVMIFTKLRWHLWVVERMFPSAVTVFGDDDQDERANKLATFREDVHETHPLVYITTTVGEVGYDVPDVSVVIQLVADGETPTWTRQRAGRAQRPMFKNCWFYDLVDDEDVKWDSPIATFPGETHPPGKLEDFGRYKLFLEDGYKDGERIKRYTSVEFKEELNAYIDASPPLFKNDVGLHCLCDMYPSGKHAVAAARPVVQLNHRLMTLWATKILTSNKKGAESIRCSTILFDTHSMWKMKRDDEQKAKTKAREAAKKQQEKRVKAFKNFGIQVRKRKRNEEVVATASAPAIAAPELGSEMFFKEIAATVPIELTQEVANMVKALIESAAIQDPDLAVSDCTPEEVWKATCKVRERSYQHAHDADAHRASYASTNVTFALADDESEPIQEKCKFLIDSLE